MHKSNLLFIMSISFFLFFFLFLMAVVSTPFPLVVKNVRASAMGIPDNDTLMLFQLVSTSAAQLNELEILVSKTEKYTERMQRYNEIAIDHTERARRIADLVDSQIYLLSYNPQNLAELTQMVRDLRYSADNIDSLLFEYNLKTVESDKNEENSKKNAQHQQRKTNELKRVAATDGHTTSIGIQNQIKMNTANTAIEVSKSNETMNSMAKSSYMTSKMIAMDNAKKMEEEKALRTYYGLDRKEKLKKGVSKK